MALKTNETTIKNLEFLKKLYVKRLTEDNHPKGMRRNNKARNQAIFLPQKNYNGAPRFNGTDLSMVLQCFDSAINDYIDGGPKW